MALLKEDTTAAGVVFAYHRIEGIYIERGADGLPASATIKLRVSSYLDAAARTSGKTPFTGRDVTIPAAALAETILTPDHVGMTAAQLAMGGLYAALKTDTFFTGSEDC